LYSTGKGRSGRPENSTTSAMPETPSASERSASPRTIRTPGRRSGRPASTRSCRMRPSAVAPSSAHKPSTWINAHCRVQNS
jgi:hypothetical protein